jgi:hypothetical protein
MDKFVRKRGSKHAPWLLDRLAERDARIAELKARLQQYQWVFSLP